MSAVAPVLVPALLLSGCAIRTVDPEPPSTAALTGAAFTQGRRWNGAAAARDRDGEWWRGFADPVLDGLVDEALRGSFDLRRAAAAARAAEARTRSARGGRLPALSAGMSATRSFATPGVGLGLSQTQGLPRVYVNTFEPSASISWQTDLFGRLRATERREAATWLATEEDYAAARQTLIAGVVRQRVTTSVSRRRLQIARSIIDSRRQTLGIVERRYERGVGGTSLVDLRLARENLAAAEAAAAPLALEMTQAVHALDELLGRKPGTTRADLSLLAELPDLAPPPRTGVPAALLDARPDLRAAALRHTAAQADVDIAVAARYPDLTIGGALGWRTEEFDDLLSTSALFGNIVGELAVRLFEGGRLQSDIDAARALLEQQAAAYAAAVLGAVREVEDALVAERRLRQQLTASLTQRAEAREAEELARSRYSRGVDALLTVLETERRRANAEDAVLRVQGSIWNARIDLHLALGGRWSAEPETAAETATP
ncbi:MAG: efflux transporter outer membrane subunit [Planctomycetota bacterium]